MGFDEFLETIPAYAKDLKLNLSTLMRQQELTPQQAWGTAVASAIASRNPQTITAVLAEAEKHLSPEALIGAKIAAAIMGMNNIYYRFQHLVGNEKYSTLPVRLRMHGLRGHGTDPVDFELWATAVSAINGCGNCMAGHEAHLREQGMSEETVAAAIRIASVIHGISATLDAEECAPTQPVATAAI